MPGVKIPAQIIERLEKSRDQMQEGLEIARELIQQLHPIADGVHLMTMGNKELLVKLLKTIQ